MGWFKETVRIMYRPDDYFLDIKKKCKQNLSSVLTGMLLVYFIASLLLYFLGIYATMLVDGLSFWDAVQSIVGQLIIVVIFSVLLFFMFHWMLKIFGSDGKLLQTLIPMVYAANLTLAFAIIPIVNILAMIYSLYALARGIVIFHTLPVSKVIWSYVIAVIVSFIIVFLLFMGIVNYGT